MKNLDPRLTHALAFVLGVVLTLTVVETVQFVSRTLHALDLATAIARSEDDGTAGRLLRKKRNKRAKRTAAAPQRQPVVEVNPAGDPVERPDADKPHEVALEPIGTKAKTKGKGGKAKSKKAKRRARAVERFRELSPEEQDEVLSRIRDRLADDHAGVDHIRPLDLRTGDTDLP